jgi:beta-lactamase regulating signal transducer with metallopeptidase domain
MTALVLESVLRSLVMAAMVWTGIKLFRVRHVLAQKIAWGMVLIVSFAMPLVIHWQASHPRAALVVPVKHAVTFRALEKKVSAIRIQPIVMSDPDAAASTAALAAAPVISVQPAYPARIRIWHPGALLRYMLPVYLIVSGALLLRLLFGLAMAMRIWRNAELASPILEPRATVRISDDIHSPVTIGSGIVLPANYVEWDRAKLRLVLAHERAHVRQGDFYLQLLASLYAAVVWFSPLGWWLKRRLAELGEALSDRAALLEAEDHSSYAEVLLQFAAMPRHGFAGVTAGVGMARSSNIQRRIERILNERIFRSAFMSGRRHALIAALLVPAGLVLATSLLHVQAAEKVKARTIAALLPASQSLKTTPRETTTVLASSCTKEDPGSAACGRPAQLSLLAQNDPPPPPAVLWAAPPAPAAPNLSMVAPAAPVILAAQAKTLTATSQEIDEDSDDDDQSSFVIVDRDHNSAYSRNSSWGNGGEADRVGKKIQGSFIWFERDGKSYVITDPQLLAQAKAYFAPQEELGRRQEELGRQQEELGRQQEEAGKQIEEVKVQIPDISKEIAELQRSIQKMSSQATQESLSELQSKLGEMQSKLGEAQSRAGEKASELGEQQGELGRRQGELGEKQGELGRQQGEIAHEASQKVKSMIDQAYRDGKARPVD